MNFKYLYQHSSQSQMKLVCEWDKASRKYLIVVYHEYVWEQNNKEGEFLMDTNDFSFFYFKNTNVFLKNGEYSRNLQNKIIFCCLNYILTALVKHIQKCYSYFSNSSTQQSNQNAVASSITSASNKSGFIR